MNFTIKINLLVAGFFVVMLFSEMDRAVSTSLGPSSHSYGYMKDDLQRLIPSSRRV